MASINEMIGYCNETNRGGWNTFEHGESLECSIIISNRLSNEDKIKELDFFYNQLKKSFLNGLTKDDMIDTFEYYNNAN